MSESRSPPHRIPSITALRAFEAAARRLHFAQAAEELAVTPGAISRQIQSLEEELAVQLFERSSRAVVLTPIGHAYALEVAEILGRLERATNRVRTRASPKPLSICAYPTFAMRWLIPRWRKFHDLHPMIDLQLTTSLQAVDAMRDGFDTVVRFGDGRLQGHASIPLASVEFFPICSPAIRDDIREPADLRKHALLHAVGRPQDWPNWLDAAGVKEEVDGASGLRFESLGLAYQAAIEGAGVAMAMGCLVADDLALGRLVQPLPLVSRSESAFYLLHPTDSMDDPRVTALCEFLTQESTYVK